LTWQGLADQLFPVNATIRYRNLVQVVMGGYAEVNDFYRLFLAPGLGYCGEGGYGPVPSGLDELVTWVEERKAPDQLLGSFTNTEGINVTRNICAWPKAASYKGSGELCR
jgi:hypothetical protein